VKELLLEGFTSFGWSGCPKCLPTSPADFVYVFLLSRDGVTLPFYVGQTSNIVRRVGDYSYPSFSAPTDFKVGEAIKYLTSKQCEIEIRIKESTTALEDERALIRNLQLSGFHLLNHLAGFAYLESCPDDEREFIERFCDMLVRQTQLLNRLHDPHTNVAIGDFKEVDWAESN
jgi:hypothetical protein